MLTTEDLQTYFEKSLRTAADYPCNLVKANNFDFALKQFSKKLSNEDVVIFDKRRWGKKAMTFFDHFEENDEYKSSNPMSEETGMELIRSLMSGSTRDPMCRFIFIHSRYSRDPLACSSEQLLYILSYLQAMPAIVDHITTFCARDSPHLQTSVRVEDDIMGMHSMALGTLGRSGKRLQHCFNLIGVEHDLSSKTDGPYLLRQTAAYYSLDLVSHHSTWIIFKGNDVVKEMIHSSANQSSGGETRRSLRNHGSLESALSSALNTHVLIFEWCMGNWAEYVDWLEERLERLSAQVQSGEVQNLTSADRIAEDVQKKGEFHAKLRQKRSVGKSDHSGPKASGVSGFMCRILRTKQMGSLDAAIATPPSATNPDAFTFIDFGQRFEFKKLQSLHRLFDQLEETRLALGQDVNAIAALRSRFAELQRLEMLKEHVTSELSDIHEFSKSAEECIRAMQGWCVRLQRMSAKVNQDISLFNATLQFRDMRTNEFFLHQTKISTDTMERLTVEMAEVAIKTRHETNSMHIITIFTLIFLPGTFVATFFSSGILDFDDFDGDLSMVNMVGFNTRWAALKLFVAICLPLMGATLSVWAFVYFLARRRQKSADQPTSGYTGHKDMERGDS